MDASKPPRERDAVEELLAEMRALRLATADVLDLLRARLPMLPTADASELAQPNADMTIKHGSPPAWDGPSQIGRRLSQAPPEFLDLFAAQLDGLAEQDEALGALNASGKPRCAGRRSVARRARGWAALHRARRAMRPVLAGDPR